MLGQEAAFYGSGAHPTQRLRANHRLKGRVCMASGSLEGGVEEAILSILVY